MAKNHNRMRQLMDRYRVCVKTILRRRKAKLIPEPDFYVNQIPYWTDESLDRADQEAVKRTKEKS